MKGLVVISFTELEETFVAKIFFQVAEAGVLEPGWCYCHVLKLLICCWILGGDAVSLLLGSSWLAISRCQEQPHLQPGKMWDGMKSSSEAPSFA